MNASSSFGEARQSFLVRTTGAPLHGPPWRARGTRRARVGTLAALAILLGACSGDGADEAMDGRNPSSSTPASRPRDPSQIAFMSNRGNPDAFSIWVMDADGSHAANVSGSLFTESAPAWSPDGSRLALERSELPSNRIVVMNADGSSDRALTDGAVDANPAWSPDGNTIAFDRRSGEGSMIVVMNADGTDLRELTSGGVDANPTWSPDGASIAFQRGAPGATRIFVMGADGSDPRAVTSGPDTDAAWSPDGRTIAFARTTEDGYSHLRLVSGQGTDDRQLTKPDRRVDGAPAWSPDGARIAFYRQRRLETGEVWSMKADGTDEQNLTNDPSIDSLPAWTRQRRTG